MTRPLGPRQAELIEKIERDGYITLIQGLNPHWFLKGSDVVPDRLVWSLVKRDILIWDEVSRWPSSRYVLAALRDTGDSE